MNSSTSLLPMGVAHKIACAALLAAAVFVATGCKSDAGAAAGATQTVGQDDVVNTDDLVAADSGGAGAAKVGEPAQLLGVARKSVENSRAHVRSVIDLIKEIAGDKKPATTGTTAVAKLPYGTWTGTKNGVELTLWVIRTAENRLRYVMAGKKGADTKVLLTGVFIKKAPRVGGGRLHVSLTNVSALFGAPNKSGSMHVWFANHKTDVKGRRVAYLNVKDINDSNDVPGNFAIDAVHKPGVGGRLRSIAIADFDTKMPGRELFAMRVLWKAAVGGRADAIYANLTLTTATHLAEVHECWGADGLRTAFASTPPDPNNAQEGDTKTCFSFGEDKVPDTVASANGKDPDPELDTLLAESGAAGIDQAEADKADVAL